MRYKTLATGAIVVLGCAANADVVLNQISLVEADNVFLWTSQDFEPALDANDLNFIEDFTVDADHLNVTRVEAVFGLKSAAGLPDSFWANVTGIRVEFYSSIAAGAGNLTGDLGSTLIPIASVTRTNLGWAIGSMSLIDMTVNVTLPGAGTYWMGVMGVMPTDGVNNQLGPTSNETDPGNQNGTFVNPGGAWGFPGNSETRPEDISYRIHAVPEPASMIALGIGAAALLARRRRRAV